MNVPPLGYNAPDFRGLENLEEARFVTIENVSSLKSLEGLEGLEKVGILVLQSLPNLESLEGLSSLQTIDDEAYYDDTTGITSWIWGTGVSDLQGLEALLRVNARFEIRDNTSLETLDGMSGVKSVRNLSIRENPELRSIDGMSSLETVDSIVVVDNPELPTCHVEEFVAGLDVQGIPGIEEGRWEVIKDNASECPR